MVSDRFLVQQAVLNATLALYPHTVKTMGAAYALREVGYDWFPPEALGQSKLGKLVLKEYRKLYSREEAIEKAAEYNNAHYDPFAYGLRPIL